MCTQHCTLQGTRVLTSSLCRHIVHTKLNPSLANSAAEKVTDQARMKMESWLCFIIMQWGHDLLAVVNGHWGQQGTGLTLPVTQVSPVESSPPEDHGSSCRSFSVMTFNDGHVICVFAQGHQNLIKQANKSTYYLKS